jgi:hypothetical protein
MVARASRRGALAIVWRVALVCLNAGYAAEAAGQARTGTPQDGYELTLSRPAAVQAFPAESVPGQGQTFVQIEVTQVDNPNRIPLSLTVHAETPERGSVYLGSFVVDPGKQNRFLVATQETLRAGGSVRVTLMPLRTVSGDEGIRLRLQRLSLLRR